MVNHQDDRRGSRLGGYQGLVCWVVATNFYLAHRRACHHLELNQHLRGYHRAHRRKACLLLGIVASAEELELDGRRQVSQDRVRHPATKVLGGPSDGLVSVWTGMGILENLVGQMDYQVPLETNHQLGA